MADIYLRQGETFIAMRERAYEAEHVLQKLVADHPEMLVGDDADGAKRWLLIEREAPVAEEEDSAGRWSLDHLFVDSDGVPTLVEVKRREDPRARRYVVAQMLDYAANGVVSWSAEQMRQRFESRCRVEGRNPAEEFRAAFGGRDADELWGRVHTNLAARRLRLVFVADSIPPELRRIVEFLNEQMGETEVLAVEVKQYVDEAGAQQTIVPRVLGQTVAAQQAKGKRLTGHWDRGSLLEAIEREHGAPLAGLTNRLLAWAEQDGLTLSYGRGARHGSVALVRDQRAPFAVYTYGRLETRFDRLAEWPSMSDEDLERLRQQLNAITDGDIGVDKLRSWPSVSMQPLLDETRFKRLLELLSSVYDKAPTT
jgi:hypothetical protein